MLPARLDAVRAWLDKCGLIKYTFDIELTEFSYLSILPSFSAKMLPKLMKSSAKSKDSKYQKHRHKQDFNNEFLENEGKTVHDNFFDRGKSKAHLIYWGFRVVARTASTLAGSTSKYGS